MLERVLPPLVEWAHGRLPKRARRRMETADLVQEAAIGALEHMDPQDLECGAAVDAYLRASIRNRIVDEIRRAGKVEVADVDSGERAADREPSPLDRAVDSEERHRFRTALAGLDEDDQLLIVGRVDLDLDYDDLAVATGRPSPDAARMATRRAVMRLARAIGKTR